MNSEDKAKKGIAKWPADALKCILEIWKKSLCEGTLNRKSIHIYTQMSIQMENFGCNFSPREIRKNIIDLIRKYRREKIKIKNGAIGNDSHLYNALDYLIGNNRVYQWEELMQKITDSDCYSSEESVVSDGSTPTDDCNVEPDCEETSTETPTSKIDFNSYSCSDEQASVEESQSEVSLKSNVPSRNLRDGTRMSTLQQTLDILQREKSNRQTLTAAKFDLIELQKVNIKQEIQYRRHKFQQETREHLLRMKHMKEEHDWHMTELRFKLDKEY